jgi:hypothetical protein
LNVPDNQPDIVGHAAPRGDVALSARWRTRRRALAAAVVLALAVLGLVSLPGLLAARRTTPLYSPPVLAGQPLYGYCSGGVYARLGSTIVLTSTGHCATEGTVATDPDGTGVRGVFGPAARDAVCPIPGHVCAASDINYLVVAADRIPWAHLNVIDMGVGGYRVLSAGEQALTCAQVAVGDLVEIDGRAIYRAGHVLQKGDNNHPEDGAYFPCMIAADIGVASGDSGGVVLVRGIPAGVTSRSYDGYLGFTPLAEGLAELGLAMCTTPNCDQVPASTSSP